MLFLITKRLFRLLFDWTWNTVFVQDGVKALYKVHELRFEKGEEKRDALLAFGSSCDKM
jgi:hypothetical protein